MAGAVWALASMADACGRGTDVAFSRFVVGAFPNFAKNDNVSLPPQWLYAETFVLFYFCASLIVDKYTV